MEDKCRECGEEAQTEHPEFEDDRLCWDCVANHWNDVLEEAEAQMTVAIRERNRIRRAGSSSKEQSRKK